MKLKEYLEAMNKLTKENPECLDMEIVYARDDEGNGYQKVSYEPSKGFFNDNDFTPESQLEECEITEKPNAICIN